MTITLNRKLNLVLTVESDVGKLYIHSVPISRAVFEDNYKTISRAFTAIYTNGLGPVAGPRVAKLLLKEEAEQLGLWAHTQQSLLGEIYRLTNVFAPTENGLGWDTIPYDAARKRGMIDDDTAAEVENAIVYFTCASSIHMKAELEVAMDGLKALWGAQTTSSTSTEYMRSLPTLTPAATTGASAEPEPTTEPIPPTAVTPLPPQTARRASSIPQ
jgi:hypothetical protein